MFTPGTITNSQRTPTKINKNDAIAKVTILLCDTIRHLQTFGIISNEMPVLILILC